MVVRTSLYLKESGIITKWYRLCLLKILSFRKELFCGTGGFSAGFEASAPSAYSTRFGVDILPIALETFKSNHTAAETIQGDIRKVSCKEVERLTGLRPGDVSVIMGGPPCRGFSSIRPFRSTKLDDPRNTLFEQFANFVAVGRKSSSRSAMPFPRC
jgi:site-specific DNA-cytosine methylase